MAAKNELKVILVLGFIVVGFSGMALASLLKEPVVQSSVQSGVGERGPASLAPEFAKTAPEKPRPSAESLDLDCKKLPTGDFSTTSDRIQIKGSNCQGQKQWVTNLSTGYTASMFFPKKSFFLTDYIQLMEGKNQIEIADADGKLINFTVERTQ